MMILQISSTDIHLIEMLFEENMFPIKGPGPVQQVYCSLQLAETGMPKAHLPFQWTRYPKS